MTDTQAASEIKLPSDVDSVPDPQNTTWLAKVGFFLCALYSGWHLYVLNIAPLETWTFRIMHIAGALILGFVLSSGSLRSDCARQWPIKPVICRSRNSVADRDNACARFCSCGHLVL